MGTDERRLVRLIREAVRVGLGGGLEAAHNALRTIRLLADVLAVDGEANAVMANELRRVAGAEDFREL